MAQPALGDGGDGSEAPMPWEAAPGSAPLRRLSHGLRDLASLARGVWSLRLRKRCLTERRALRGAAAPGLYEGHSPLPAERPAAFGGPAVLYTEAQGSASFHGPSTFALPCPVTSH